MNYKRVLVGMNDSPAAASAARWAAEAAAPDGEVLAVTGSGAPLIAQAAGSAATGLGMFPHQGTRREEAARALETWCEPLRETGVTVRTFVEDTDPEQAILDVARREDVDLIVIGHRGETGLLHRFFQGLSDHLIDYCRRPVVVVPYSEADPPG
ncbi:MAG TPA: universal stress protein [Acidimicrobiia bacterium]|nr:universal stress protein [Acidimicrobiia bacterium]